MVLKIENRIKKLGNFDKNLINEIKNYDGSIHGTVKFEDNTGSDLDVNEFDLLIKYLSNIFNGKTGIDDTFIKQGK